MITLKVLKWSNIFSYGENNTIRFDEYPIVQLVGKNGHGKSSIALILEEVLFNKNSKGIKKSDILNRYSNSKSYSIELEFDKDGDAYVIQTTRGSSQTVLLTKNGDNISAHTATATFKLIEEIIGIDHKTFAQLLYQSSASSLEFLVATDTTRKKFLIDLLNLTKYLEAFEIFKKLAKEVETEVTALESKVSTTQSWLDTHLKENLEELPVEPDINYTDNPISEATELSSQLKNIDNTNKAINKNELNKQLLANIPIEETTKPIPTDIDPKLEQIEKGGHEKSIKDASALISKIAKLNGTCPTCLQEVNREKLDELIAEQELLKTQAQEAIIKLDRIIDTKNKNAKEVARLTKLKQDWETLHQVIDPNLPSETLNPDEISKKLKTLENEISRRSKELEALQLRNKKVAAHNARVQLITSQMDEMKSSIDKYSQELSSLIERQSILQILQKTFSTNGLIAYKIECLVKDLESLTNEYLSELSDGRFQLTFKVSSGDKLNVIITDHGKDIDILALSGGERARVNTATLLAIRKLMQSLSSARINLLILDETIDSLDVDGKERLVEVLLKEEHLNTFLISHGFTHPLLEKITVIKTSNISRLE